MGEISRVHLSDLCAKTLLYLSTFKSQIGRTKMEAEWVRGRIHELLRQQEADARRVPHLYDLYRKAEYLLVAAIDGIILCSAWEHAESWRLLEQEKYQTAVGGTRFFQLMKDPAYGGAEMAEVFYLCLCAGFQGMYLGRPRQELEEVRKNVHASLKEIPRDSDEVLTPQAYAETRRDVLAPLPIVHAVRIAILLAVATLLVFVLTPVIGDYRLEKLREVLGVYKSTQVQK